MPGEAHIPHELPPTQADVKTRRALEEKLAQFEELQARHEREREAEIRAAEMRHLAAEYRSIADDPDTLRGWMRAYRVDYAAVPTVAADVLRAVAGDLEHRLGGYTGRTDG